nr:nucleotide exchange factor GrpE [Mycoplasmopsis bovis]
MVKAQAKILSLYAKSEMLARDNEFLKAQLERAKETPKTIVVPDEMKKQIHQYALQDFFEQFVNYYSLYKTTTLSSEKQAELLDDPKLKAFAKGYRMITWQFDELFKKYNFIEIKPIEGEIFNPEYQKVNDQFIDDEFPTNTIINVHSSAFMFALIECFMLHLLIQQLESTDPQAKVLIEKSGDNAYHKTPGKLHTLRGKSFWINCKKQ